MTSQPVSPSENLDAGVLGFPEIDQTMIPRVGGKGANLGELSRIGGIRVPPGFCVTTSAYRRIAALAPGLDGLMDQLAALRAADSEQIKTISAAIRGAIEGVEIPGDVETGILSYLATLGEAEAYAVRSSATAEDLPLASFAGQQDTYLNIIGKAAILTAIRKCWASLFTDRAVVYRIQNRFDHRKVALSVVVQRMVFPEAAGILFTADPVTGNRKVTSIDASFGLGEALVSGLVDADIYKVQAGAVTGKKIAVKKVAIAALKEGGTRQQPVGPEKQGTQTLPDAQILALEKTGRQIEAHFSRPQDVEWCLADGQIYIVQSRPITTLYPVPAVNDGKNHVYMSLGHQQNMTDAWKPLGLSLFPIWLKKISSDPLVDAGGRPYIDVSPELASPLSRKTFVNTGLGSVDRLIQKALQNVLNRKEYVKTLLRGKATLGLNGGSMGDMVSGLVQSFKISRENDAGLIQGLVAKDTALARALEQQLEHETGEGLVAAILRDMDEAYKSIVLENYGVAIAYVFAQNWLDKNLKKGPDEKNSRDVLSLSLANNVTAEMGLDLLDVADAARQVPAVLDYFQHPGGDTFFADLARLEGGAAFSDAIQGYLGKYGFRCPGEIDISRPRWSEKPAMLVPLILNNIKNFAPGAHETIFEQKRLEAEQMAGELVSRLEQQPGGLRKAKQARKNINVYRNFISFREYPKYAMMRHYIVYKQALLREAARLAKTGILQEPEDIFFLSLEEIRLAAQTNRLDPALIPQRKSDYAVFEKLTPPRVMTSDGEVIPGDYDPGGFPAGALIGIPVSSGSVEGRARVITSLEDAAVEAGDILVTAFTDPSWTPLFVSIKGLVTEVGGMATHGAIVAREYGIPAVASVENATRLIKDGQRIRINGTKGCVELLS